MKTLFYNQTAYISDLDLNGDSDKTLFLVHGAGLSKGLWERQLGAFPGLAATIAIDLPGHGESRNPAKKNITEYADAVMDLVRHTGARQPVLCGLSMGGAVCLDLLIRYPEFFVAGILMHTGAKLTVNRLLFDTLKKGIEEHLDMIAAFAVSPKSDSKKMKPLIRDISVLSVETATGDFTACNTFDRMGDLSAVKVPVLVVTGSDDLITPGKYGAYLVEHISDSRLFIIKDAGHLSPLERPEAVNEVISGFLTEISG
ncbi:MAG: alpha/beta hydrolase [Deltaproteobacteria bacterium]|nr:alpha/beta hydrolase [Deltaproteobacteria bacterium]